MTLYQRERYIRAMVNDLLYSGIIGGIIGALVSAIVASILNYHYQKKLLKQQLNFQEKLFEKQRNHDKDMQRRDANIKRTGIPGLREVGGG